MSVQTDSVVVGVHFHFRPSQVFNKTNEKSQSLRQRAFKPSPTCATPFETQFSGGSDLNIKSCSEFEEGFSRINFPLTSVVVDAGNPSSKHKLGALVHSTLLQSTGHSNHQPFVSKKTSELRNGHRVWEQQDQGCLGLCIGFFIAESNPKTRMT